MIPLAGDILSDILKRGSVAGTLGVMNFVKIIQLPQKSKVKTDKTSCISAVKLMA
jgi:hypothetical protein